MDILREILEESSMLILAVILFIYFVGVKMSCPHCLARFYYRSNQNKCPCCGKDLNYGGNPTELKRGDYICPACAYHFHFQLSYCPQCNCTFDTSFYEGEPIELKEGEDIESEKEEKN